MTRDGCKAFFLCPENQNSQFCEEKPHPNYDVYRSLKLQINLSLRVRNLGKDTYGWWISVKRAKPNPVPLLCCAHFAEVAVPDKT